MADAEKPSAAASEPAISMPICFVDAGTRARPAGERVHSISGISLWKSMRLSRVTALGVANSA
jgi:hypothetical protein